MKEHRKHKKTNHNPRADLRLTNLSLARGPINWRSKPHVDTPNIQLTASGLKINGFKLNFDISKLLSTKFGLLLGLLISLSSAKAQTGSHHYQDSNGTVYNLFLSGLENLTGAISALNSSQCYVNVTNRVPQALTLIANYYDHCAGISTPCYAATLSRDSQGVTNNTVVDCISNLLTEAHNEWESQSLSYKSILAIVGGFLGLILIAGIAFCLSTQKDKCPAFKSKKEKLPETLDETPRPNV